MPSSKFPLPRAPRSPTPSRRGQQGIVLFIALIVMVALSLAGIALIRSIDTTSSVTGNIAFRQAAMLQANYAVEEAVGHVYLADSRALPADMIDVQQDALDKCYVATFDPTKDSLTSAQPALPAGVPEQLWKKTGVSSLSAQCRKVDTNTDNRVAYLIQRMCSTAIASPADANQAQCELMTPKQSLGTTVGDEAINIGKYPLYRVTVRVDGPNNALTFVQAMIRG